ncbi:SART-1 family protein DOT2, partial [Linum grandiflorum]
PILPPFPVRVGYGSDYPGAPNISLSVFVLHLLPPLPLLRFPRKNHLTNHSPPPLLPISIPYAAVSMDALISSALEEVCYRGTAGVLLSSLWTKLNPPPSSPAVKASLWSNLVSIPTVQFVVQGKEASPLSPQDKRIQRVEDAEKLKLKIVAKEHLRDSFVGLYDVPSTGFKPLQRQALERLAIAREDGITQMELAKEFGMEGRNFFYIVKNLESRNLIVRQPATVRTIEAGGAGETKSCVRTNLMFLSRYATRLDVQQVLEINKEEQDLVSPDSLREADVDEEESSAGDRLKDDVLVKDYLPAMQAICDKLEGANGNVLVVSDIKKELGYSGYHGHKAWRLIFQKLKEAALVEGFDAKVNEKVEHCIRLLKKFSPDVFETKLFGGSDRNKQLKFGRRPKMNEQLLELPIDHQIFDVIAAKGTEGATGIEVCSRLGLEKKKTYERFNDLISRFGMRCQAESHKKTAIYRYWTPASYKPQASNPRVGKLETSAGHAASEIAPVHTVVPKKSAERSSMNNHLISGVDSTDKRRVSDGGMGTESSKRAASRSKFVENGRANSGQVLDIDHVSKGAASSVGPDVRSNGASSETSQITLLKQPYQIPLSADTALREQRILNRLQEEKILLRVVLHKWLISLEKDKGITMGRRTIDRILNKLQEEGHCRCVTFYVPSVTNCGRSRMAHVVLHPSIDSVLPEQVYDKLREFEKHSRQASSRCNDKDSFPVLSDVIRTQVPVDLDDQTAKSEAIRFNGFVLAKMVRAKLLYNVLWEFLRTSDGWDDILSSGLKVFSLQAAVKTIPLEVFLQVAGSTQKVDNLVEKCKLGLRLSDLPVEEYKSLMDTLASSRLSKVVDILRRLKLIRLIPVAHSEDGLMLPHAMFIDAMELKPYIEEPPSVVAKSLDLRPRYRHDFFLSSKEAVDDYWNTLEFCYAAADPKAASHAFPGSAVPEVFSQPAWKSARVMSAEKRTELLKRIANESANKKLSYKECEKIAMDLKLTLQQVLHFYYNKRYRCPDTDVNTNIEDPQPAYRLRRSSRKRKKSSQNNSQKDHAVDEELAEPEVAELSDGAGRDMKRQCPLFLREDDHSLSVDLEQCPVETVIDTLPAESNQLSQYALSKIRRRREKRFLWTDDADRQLITQYARQRAILGVRFHRVDWNQVSCLPGPPRTCARRITTLKRDKTLRKALMKLCNILSERYVKYLEKSQSTCASNHLTRVLHPCSTVGGLAPGINHTDVAGSEDYQWDDFNERSIKEAFDEIILYKQVNRKAGKAADEWSNLQGDVDGYNVEEFGSYSPGGSAQNLGQNKRSESRKKIKHHKLHEKFMKCLSESSDAGRQLYKSLAVSNAVELLKLVFLSSSTTPELQNMLGETLRHYSEHDIFAAFSYLRENKILIGSSGGPFVLSQQFLHNISRSHFPTNTGKRAARFSNWLHKGNNFGTGGSIDLKEDLHCGDIFQLFALVSSGEMTVSPCLPDEGLGMADDQRSSKRKPEDDGPCDRDKAKKLKPIADSETCSRREKGFPGIRVSICCATILPANALDSVNDGEKDKVDDGFGQKEVHRSSPCSDVPQSPDFDSITPSARLSSQSSWETMAGYANYLHANASGLTEGSSFSSEVFMSTYTAIHKAGDQGLSIEEVSQTLAMAVYSLIDSIGFKSDDQRFNSDSSLQGLRINLTSCFLLQVNAYDSVRVVDALYRSKYTLTLKKDGDPKPPTVVEQSERSGDGIRVFPPKNKDVKDPRSFAATQPSSKSDNDVHKVTILNLPDEVAISTEAQTSNSQETNPDDQEIVDFPEHHTDDKTYIPIFPWINGDGTKNKVVYRGLVRRALGTVMQNPGILEEDIIKRMDVLNPQQEKRIKQYQEELKLKQMKNSDTSSLSVERMRETQAQLKTPYLVLSGHVKPGQTSDLRSGFATVDKDLLGGLTPMLGDKKVEHFLGIKRKPDAGNDSSTPKKPRT